MDIVNQFGIKPTLLLAQIVNFAILVVLLKIFLYKPILKMLAERKSKIAKSLKDAEEIEKRLEQTNIEQEKILDKARNDSSVMIENAKKETKELSEKMIAETKVTVEEMLAKSSERMKLEKEQMMSEVKKDLADLVVAATAKVAQKTVDDASSRKLVDETVKEVAR